jgi:hypothetical protein
VSVHHHQQAIVWSRPHQSPWRMTRDGMKRLEPGITARPLSPIYRSIIVPIAFVRDDAT